MRAKKILELESIRGVAAFLVFLSHVPNWFEPFHQFNIIRNGGLMVELFFVLSGFVIFTSYGARLKSFADIARFQFLRFGRLYPIHLTFLMVFVFFECLKQFFINDPTSPPFTPGVSGPREFLENLTLIQALGFSNKPDSFNAPSWSISAEFYTYSVFAFLAIFLVRRHYIAHILIVFVLTVLLVIELEELNDFTRLMNCMAGFSVGCLVSILSSMLKGRYMSFLGSFGLISILLLAVFLVSDLRAGGSDSVIVYFLTGAIILGVVNGSDNPLKSTLRNKGLLLLGEHSYAIYMSHWAVIYAADVILKRWILVPSANNDIDLALGEFCITLAVVTLGVVAISWASYKIIEKPFRSRSRAYISHKFN
ncbi:MAG: acyltransferase [Burkholderiales bacterium]|nr:acyltransferase [Burkholderiales bacterium]